MQNSLVETIVGAFVVLVAISFLIFGYTSTSQNPAHGSVIYKAAFDSIEGISTNSEIKVGGVRVGTVSNVALDEAYQVILTLKVDRELKIPSDSSVEVATAGLIGDKFISIIPGGSETSMEAGETFAYAKSGMNLEKFIGQLIASFVNKSETPG